MPKGGTETCARVAFEVDAVDESTRTGWSEHFAATLLRVAPVGERAATVRAVSLNLGIVAVLVGVQAGRPLLAAVGACLVGAVVLAHAAGLAGRIGRVLPTRRVAARDVVPGPRAAGPSAPARGQGP